VNLVLVAAGALAATATLVATAPRLYRLRGTAPIAAVAGVSALVGASATCEPTGVDPIDVALRAALAAAWAVAASRSHRWALVVAVAGVAVAGIDADLAWPAFAALGVAGARLVVTVSSPTLGALVGAAAASTAMRLAPSGPSGTTAVVAGLALGLIAVSALTRSPRKIRRRVLRVSGALALVATVATVALGVAVLGARGSLQEATADFSAGLDASRQGDPEAALVAFRSAAAGFDRAEGRIDAWWARPARAVPGVGHNAQTLQQLTATGTDLAAVAAAAAPDADLSILQLRNAAIDVGALEALQEPLQRVSTVLDKAEADLATVGSPWVVAPVADVWRSLRDQVALAAPQAADAVAVAEVAPALLGADGPRRYFLALQTPVELRGSGGVLGNFAVLSAVDGRLSLERAGRATELNQGGDVGADRLADVAPYLARYTVPGSQFLWQDITLSPHFPDVAGSIEQLYPRFGGEPLDGVISLDPIAIAAFLELTGPVSVPEWPEPLGPLNAADVLLRQQYLALGDDGGFTNPERIDFLDSLVEALFERLETMELPGPARMAEVLGPMVRQDRLQLHSPVPAEQAVFERLGAAGSLAPVVGDYVSLVTNNSGGNKIDLFLDRALSYRATFDPATGAVTATAEINLANRAPASGLPEYVIGSSGPTDIPPGTNRLFLSFLSPLALEGATLDGELLPMSTEVLEGRNVYSAFVSIPPESSRVVTLELAGSLRPGPTYQLDVGHQPTIEPDAVEIRLEPPPGWRLDELAGMTRSAAETAATTIVLDQEQRVSASFRR
jgi:hypothetical protein